MKSLEAGSTMKHRNTGRKKIPIKKIEETTSRQVTFSKRRTGLFKKASELCVLTGAEMAILVQSPGGHCYAFGHPSVEAVIDRHDESNGTTLVSPKQPSVDEIINMRYAELEKELEREKRRHEMIQQEKIGKSSSSEFVPWYEQGIEGLEEEELEQYVAALVELKRKVLVRAGDLANMESASMLSLGPTNWSSLPSTFDNAPLNMQAFGDGTEIQSGDLGFGDGIKIENNTLNVPTSDLDFGDGIRFVSNTNAPASGLHFGDRMKFQNNTMNGSTSDLHFGGGIKIGNNTMTHQYFGDGSKIQSNTMNGPTNAQDFGDGNKNWNNTMNGPTNHQYFGDGTNNPMNGQTNHQYFGDGTKFDNYTMNGPENGLDFGDGNNTEYGPSHLEFGDGNNHENNTMNGHFGDLGSDIFY